ncbi:conserved exported hypothetical protein [Frankia canadensis]|uniref:Secreted protein n=1 Tax=Frankia canadensis TaxID=1836972 RepID=A0A2I2KJT3_9ACTN|nr:hypothetical protein [Frankia canadensis]SNQ45929.1 conserved exported hypothetical protein [Frankia canadensis]SOU53219.1 conserved exported hypothetical protein [Frankia canadensis]
MLPVRHLPSRARRALSAAGLTGAVLLAVAACGGGSGGQSASSHQTEHAGSAESTASATPSMAGHSMTGHPASGMGSGMPDMATGDGLAAQARGLGLTLSTSSLPVNQASAIRFQIRGADGKPVTSFEPDQTKLMHFYLIRSDLTGFQHVHPTMSADGTWTADVKATPAGSYRAYASFIARAAGTTIPLVLGQPVTVPGTAATVPLPAASTSTTVDGYTLTVSGDRAMAGMTHPLTVTVTRNGKPVTDLRPYLETYAHLTAFHAGDLAFAHLHPRGAVHGDHGGPTLSFEAALPRAGDWRLFLQFQTAGTLHTAALTLGVG